MTCNYFLSVRHGNIGKGESQTIHILFISVNKILPQEGEGAGCNSFYVSILEGVVGDCVGR
jgi:hypothetical protein